MLINRLIAKIKDINLKELLTGGFVSFSIKIAGILFSYALTILITRLYGAYITGIFALFITFLNICAVFGRLGVDTALLRFIAEYSSQNKMELVHEIYVKALKIIIPFCLLISVLLYFSSPFIADRFFQNRHLSVYFRLVSFIILPMALIFINSECLRALKKIKEYAFLQDLSIQLFSVTILAAFLLFAQWETAPFIAYVVGVSIAFLLSVFFWSKASGAKTFLTKDNIYYKTILSISIPVFISNSLVLFMGWTDKILLGVFTAESNVGIYNVAFKLAALTSIPLLAFNSIAAPKFAQFYGNNDIKSLAKLSQQLTKLIFWITLPAFLLFFIYPSFFLNIFGEEFRIGKNALIMMLTGQFVNTISGPVLYILNMTGKQKIFRNVMFIIAALNVTLNVILIPKYSINGAAFSTMVCVILLNILLFMAVRYYYKFYTFSLIHVFTLKKGG